MKKTFKFAALALCAAAFAISCDKSEIEISVTPKVEKQIFTCTIDGSDAATKLGISATGKVTWEAGDEIMIHGGAEGASRQKITLTADDISADGKTATLAVEMEPYDRTDAGVKSSIYAQYPAANVPSGEMYYECCFAGTDAPLMAACDDGNNFHFYNLCGIISYTVSGDFDKVVFEGNSKETVAFDFYQVRVRDDGKGPVVNYHKPGNGFKNYTELKSIEKNVVADGSTVNYLYLPKGTNFGLGFTFKFYKNDTLVKIAKTEKAVNVAHGKLLPLGNISGHLEDYVAPQHSDHTSAITGATDLSAQQANCYVISAAGAYKFPALKGNSEDAAGEVFGASIVWETYNNAEEVTPNSVIAAVDFENNWIYFKTPETLKAGNALIAAKDAQDKIIWSWHIWIPATAIESNTYGGIYSSALMDRNLGALVAATTTSVPVESFGLHYEWGRKDPFVGARGIADNNFAKVSGEATSIGYGMSLAESIANPVKYGVYTEADSWGNWLTPHDSNHWQNSAKTIYDPCPKGYRVPKRDTAQPMHGSDLSTVTGWSDVAASGDNAAYFTLGNPATVFPYCGLVCENGKYIDHLGARTFIWTAYASSSSGSGYMMDVRLKSTHALTSTVTARGCSVRCVAE